MTDDTISVRIDSEAAAVLANAFGSKELRSLASNTGVSRSRGDTKADTADRIAAQDPALTARIIEARGFDASPFREEREVGEERISLDEAMNRARHRKMRLKLRSLKNATEDLSSHDVLVDWEYGGSVRAGGDVLDKKPGYDPGVTSITIKPAYGADMHWMLEARAHIHLTPHGRCTMLDADDAEYVDRNTAKPGREWRLGMSRIERFYSP